MPSNTASPQIKDSRIYTTFLHLVKGMTPTDQTRTIGDGTVPVYVDDPKKEEKEQISVTPISGYGESENPVVTGFYVERGQQLLPTVNIASSFGILFRFETKVVDSRLSLVPTYQSEGDVTAAGEFLRDMGIVRTPTTEEGSFVMGGEKVQ